MKKIMFSDKYGLTQAVLKMRKTMTRRIFPYEVHPFDTNEDLIKYSRYKIGEVVAIAQAYKDTPATKDFFKDAAFLKKYKGTKGWNNKMFVRADIMPHHIFITEIKVEQLQDISNEDCLKEGIDCVYEYEYPTPQGSKLTPNGYGVGFTRRLGSSPKYAFAALIDKVCGKGTWERNPWCFCYKFELID